MNRYQLYQDSYAAIKEVIDSGKWKKRTLTERFQEFLYKENFVIGRLSAHLTKSLNRIIKKYKDSYGIMLCMNDILPPTLFGYIRLLSRKKRVEINIDLRKYVTNDTIHEIGNDIIKRLALVFVHEFVHYQQYISNWGYFSIPKVRIRPDADDNHKSYLSDHLEIEAWAVETAAELSECYIPGVIKMLSSSVDVVANISPNFKTYHERRAILGEKVYRKYVKHLVKNLELFRE